jgi:hypothetical protein
MWTGRPTSMAHAADVSSAVNGDRPLKAGEDILANFLRRYGIYRLVRRSRLLRAIRYGWKVMSGHEDGRVLVWLGRRVR